MEKYETLLKSALMPVIKKAMPSYVVFRHEDVRNGGHPDFSVSGNGLGSWWEVKHATPKFGTKGNQEFFCRELARETFCRYIIYFDGEDQHKTYIIHPREVFGKKGRVEEMEIEARAAGHNHYFVAWYIQQVHKNVQQLRT